MADFNDNFVADFMPLDTVCGYFLSFDGMCGRFYTARLDIICGIIFV